MPCVAGVHCKIPSHTPGPPSYTIHMCRKCDGYLHGICGETDPDGGNNDCKRVCEGQQCLSVLVQPQQQHQRKGSGGNTMSPPPSTLRSLNLSSAVGSSAGRCSQNGDSLSKKPAFSGGQKRANLSLNTKLDVLNHLHQKKLKVAAVAEIFKIAARTVRQIKADEEKIRGKIESRPGAGNAKSSKGFKFPPHQHDGGVGRASRQAGKRPEVTFHSSLSLFNAYSDSNICALFFKETNSLSVEPSELSHNLYSHNLYSHILYSRNLYSHNIYTINILAMN